MAKLLTVFGGSHLEANRSSESNRESKTRIQTANTIGANNAVSANPDLENEVTINFQKWSESLLFDEQTRLESFGKILGSVVDIVGNANVGVLENTEGFVTQFVHWESENGDTQTIHSATFKPNIPT